jgi:hypothetical protein
VAPWCERPCRPTWPSGSPSSTALSLVACGNDKKEAASKKKAATKKEDAATEKLIDEQSKQRKEKTAE